MNLADDLVSYSSYICYVNLTINEEKKNNVGLFYHIPLLKETTLSRVTCKFSNISLLTYEHICEKFIAFKFTLLEWCRLQVGFVGSNWAIFPQPLLLKKENVFIILLLTIINFSVF